VLLATIRDNPSKSYTQMTSIGCESGIMLPEILGTLPKQLDHSGLSNSPSIELTLIKLLSQCSKKVLNKPILLATERLNFM
jgi:hypothetical protein